MTTTVPISVIEDQAKYYETSVTDIDTILGRGRTHAQQVMDSSSSAATQALNEVIEGWVNTTRKTMLDGMTELAGLLRQEKENKVSGDQSAGGRIQNFVPPATSSFLGG